MANKATKQPAKLQDALVLYKYILNLFGHKDFDELSRDLKEPNLEGVDDENVSRFHYVLKGQLYRTQSVTEEQLFEYDQNIVRHTKEINEQRIEKIQWKYYQYLALLFTEIYLDRYFSNREQLLKDINRFLSDNYNHRPDTWHEMPAFKEDDLNKLAFWCATGSGKTLMMHINIKQYRHYAEKYNAPKLNRVIILTPNEGLSVQHLKELEHSGMHAGMFSKNGGKMFQGDFIDVIDINKLADTDGDKTVAVESFEGNNLVMVDEGHKGSGGEVWKGYRNTLTQNGFSFEYSATFGQAIAAANGKNKKDLLEEYGKATLFDYSYHYFYSDGYGKDYRIMNMASWNDDELLNMYLTAYLLCLYEQTLVYENSPLVKNRFLIARPLGIFVGSSVNAVRKAGGRDVSDVVQILLFLHQFINNPQEFSGYIKRLLNSKDGIKNSRGYSLFANSFQLVKEQTNGCDEDKAARDIYYKLKEKLFHSNVPNAQLHIDKQNGGDKEIGLRVGSSDYFGVINVGDSDSLIKLCEANGLSCETKEFGSSRLFNGINDEDSPVNILIGSKKFSEGWSSWRVSVMGLMNVGRSEGSEIIQLFGRGVRLKGFQYSLKRSSALKEQYHNLGDLPKGLQQIETLNIFGVRANYMDNFREYLEREGLPHNDGSYTKVKIPTVNLLGDKKLKIVRLKKGCDFKKQIVVRPEEVEGIVVEVDKTTKVKAIWSKHSGVDESAGIEPNGKLEQKHLCLLDWNKIFFALQKMKNERGWHNIEIDVDKLKNLMQAADWYELHIPSVDLEFHDYGHDVARWEDITISLLRAYIDKAYKKAKGKWESKYMETVYLDANDPNFFTEYMVEVNNDKNEWILELQKLQKQITSGNLKQDFSIYGEWIRAMEFDRHLFYPILCLREKDANGNNVLHDKQSDEPLIKISPVALNVGETKFVTDIRKYYEANKGDLLKDKEIYLLRNESRKGIGFFEASNFYPDFILWVNDRECQRVTFIDPKGIRNLRGLKDSKIQLYKQLKTDVEPSLNDASITLDSYIISNTPYSDVKFWDESKSKADFEKEHVLFQDDVGYIEKLFKMLL